MTTSNLNSRGIYLDNGMMTKLIAVVILCAVVSVNAAGCHFEIATDLNGYCKVDLGNFALLAQESLPKICGTLFNPSKYI